MIDWPLIARRMHHRWQRRIDDQRMGVSRLLKWIERLILRARAAERKVLEQQERIEQLEAEHNKEIE